MKTCSRCGKEKPLDDFYTDRFPRNKTGRQSRCKECAKAYAKQQVRERDPAVERERLRAFRKANPDKDRQYGRRWREKNGERANALARERHRKYRAANAVRRAAAQRARTAKVAAATDNDLEYMTLLRGDPCAYCGSTAGTVDHIVPLHKGGTPDWGNLTAACRSCNSSKNATSLLVFLARK